MEPAFYRGDLLSLTALHTRNTTQGIQPYTVSHGKSLSSIGLTTPDEEAYVRVRVAFGLVRRVHQVSSDLIDTMTLNDTCCLETRSRQEML